MPSTTWPFPRDSAVGRARRVAHAYRASLHDVDPAVCDDLDEACWNWGERWIVPRVLTYDLDDWLTAGQAADIAMVTVAAIRQARRRGRLSGEMRDGQWRYRAADVILLTGASQKVA